MEKNNYLKIKFAQTTTDYLKCLKCGKLLRGKRGYVKITKRNGRSWFGSPDFLRDKFCMDCWNKINSDIRKDMKTKNERYENLIKKEILNKLK